MKSYSIPHFGTIDLDELAPYSTATIELKNRSVILDINLLSKTAVEESEMAVIKSFLENLEAFSDKVSSILPTDYAARGATYEYLQEFLRELDDDDLISVLHGTSEELETEERMLLKFYVKRISFYPEKEDDLLVVFDYAISGNITEDALVVLINKQMKLKDIVIERA
ncbi:MAG: DUF2004 domain-containing protein [Saprospiraceae bacterium]